MKAERCRACGGNLWVECVDNDGQKYVGCACCIIVFDQHTPLPTDSPLAQCMKLAKDFTFEHKRLLGSFEKYWVTSWRDDKNQRCGFADLDREVVLKQTLEVLQQMAQQELKL